MPNRCRLAAILTAALALSSPVLAFDSPLSEEAVREAYFLGQRHDDSLARVLAKYSLVLPPPDRGPHIASVTFLTPFAVVAQSSSQHINYSAQQAALDHRGQKESVKIIVEIRFTASYPAVVVRPTGASSSSPQGFTPRPYNFWKDFDVQTLVNDTAVAPFSSYGEPNIVCDLQGGCDFIGATITLEYAADLFSANSASVVIAPPEGESISVDFDLTELR